MIQCMTLVNPSRTDGPLEVWLASIVPDHALVLRTLHNVLNLPRLQNLLARLRREDYQALFGKQGNFTVCVLTPAKLTEAASLFVGVAKYNPADAGNSPARGESIACSRAFKNAAFTAPRAWFGA